MTGERVSFRIFQQTRASSLNGKVQIRYSRCMTGDLIIVRAPGRIWRLCWGLSLQKQWPWWRGAAVKKFDICSWTWAVDNGDDKRAQARNYGGGAVSRGIVRTMTKAVEW